MAETNMTARQYLGQAYLLNQRINSKLTQLRLLRGNAVNITANMDDIRVHTSPDHSKMENTILKIIQQEREIDDEIDKLVDLKAEVRQVIKAVPSIEHQLVLEMRYLCFRSWEQIAVEMDCGIDNVFRLHRKALEMVEVPNISNTE